MNISQIRKETIGCNDVIHFNNAGASLMPKPVADAIRNYTSEEEITGGYELESIKRAELNTFYDYAAALLHCEPHHIAYTTNATDSYNKALSAISFEKNDVVLISEHDYPSNYIAFISLEKRYDIKLITIKNTATGTVDLVDLEHKIQTYSPRLISITHIPTSSGLVQPVVEIGEIVKKYKVLYLIDACQSLGQIKVDAMATHAHFISGTFRKFLRGPRGAGLLYVSDQALDLGLEPLFIDLRGAEWIAGNAYRSRADAKRFEDWETSYALMMASKEALKYVLEIGIEAIESRNIMLVSKMRKMLAEVDFIKLQDRGEQLSSIVTFSMDKLSQEATKKYFADHGINIYTTSKSSALFDFEEKGIEWVVRVSPHYYNTESEIDRFIEVLKLL